MNPNGPWLQCRPASGRPQIRLFCFPHAGGGASAFHSWRAAFPSAVQLCSVLLPGRESRRSEPAFTQLNLLATTLARELAPWLDLPYAVFGHSMGAMLAFEWIRELRRSGQAMPARLFLSGRRAPDLNHEAAELHMLPDPQFIKELTRRYGGIPDEIRQVPELVDYYLPVLRADLTLVESYHFRKEDRWTVL